MQRLVNILSLLSFVIVMIACDGSKTSNAGNETADMPAEKAERAAFPGEEVTYGTEAMTMKGFLSFDRNRSGQRPGVLVIHEWWGHNDFVRERASQLADMGYVALAVDMYGVMGKRLTIRMMRLNLPDRYLKISKRERRGL